MTNLELITILIACYAALVATIGLGWNVYNIWRDRAEIKVKVSEGITGGSRGIQIFIKAINNGRRPVTLKSAGFALKNGKQIFMINCSTCEFPQKLSEGESCTVFTEKRGLLQDLEKEKTNIVNAWYRDATDQIYKIKYKLEYA